MTIHNMSRTKEYRSWWLAKDRCTNQTNTNYPRYGGVGVTMSEEYIESFLAFITDIGKMPNNTERWTLDRIDSTKGYEKGNIRWATNKEQTRNRRKQSNNLTGVAGVYWTTMNGDTYAVSSWYEDFGTTTKQKHKSFNVKKYGLLPAFAMAVVHRNAQIDRLNQLGYGYSSFHGT